MLGKFAWEVEQLDLDEYNDWIALLTIEAEERKKAKGKK